MGNVDPALTPFVHLVRMSMQREHPRRIVMLQISKSSPPARVPDALPDTANRDLTDVLLGVLRSIEPYEACILEAERDGDFEVAAFLRELRRQDIVRARESTRLLMRGDARVELSVGS